MSSKLSLRPIADRLFVDYTESVAPTEVGGILLPANFQPGGTPQIIYLRVTVVAVGPDVKFTKAGDEIIVAKQRLEKITHDDQVYWLIVEGAVVGIVAP